MRFKPNEPGKGIEFIDSVVGGRVPKEYIPAVNKGIEEACQAGVLAGYQVVDFKVTLYDGTYHDVDSSEVAFKVAGSMAFRNASKKAAPVLMEPVMKVECVIPDEYLGDVMGSLNSRRGHIDGMDMHGTAQVVQASVPLSEMFGYATNLRSQTQGRGTFTMQFEHFAAVPKGVAEKLLGQK